MIDMKHQTFWQFLMDTKTKLQCSVEMTLFYIRHF